MDGLKREDLKEEKLLEIEDRIENCKKCDLWKTRKNPVAGDGSANAKIMFIGEAPGFNEDEQGKPFVGKAGKIFDELLDSVNLKREDVYITNVLKCRPPQNRNPKESEIEACMPYLNRQIEAIKPKIICCLGTFAMSCIMKKFNIEKTQSISKIHGKVFHYKGLFDSIKIIPLYHPAVAVYDADMLNTLKKDFEVLAK